MMQNETELAQRKRLQRSIDYIELHLTDPLDISLLADIACFSKSRFQELFKYFCGVTAAQYVRERRLTEAKVHLLDEKKTTSAISTLYGYQSEKAFARAFERFHGITPADYRRTHGGTSVRPPMALSAIDDAVNRPHRLKPSSASRIRQETWSISYELDMPDLSPEVVQFAIFDSDPLVNYRREISNAGTAERLRNILSEYENAKAALRHVQALHSMGIWNRLFSAINGDQMYLLIGNSIAQQGRSISSNSLAKRKWLTTKAYGSPRCPICWCIHFSAEAGKVTTIRLDRKNVVDIRSISDAYVNSHRLEMDLENEDVNQ